MEGWQDTGRAEARIARLELAMLELVTALGMLVSELAGRDDLALSSAGEVERALDHGWSTLVGDAFRAVEPVPGDLAAIAGSNGWAPDALRRAMASTGAAVGAVYEVPEVGGRAMLVASEGYPDEVMEDFRVISLDAELPVSVVARTGRPLWFRERGEIIEQYPHLADAHELTEEALGAPGVQGAVVPLTLGGRVWAVILVGFTAPGDIESAGLRAAETVLGDETLS